MVIIIQKFAADTRLGLANSDRIVCQIFSDALKKKIKFYFLFLFFVLASWYVIYA